MGGGDNGLCSVLFAFQAFNIHVFRNLSLKIFLSDEVNTPPPENLPGTVNPVPYFIVGDEAFPLKPNLMRPYPSAQVRGDFDKRRLNYRLSRARRVVENAFGKTHNSFDF